MNRVALFVIAIAIFPGILCAGQFKPYKIKAGVAYYSDEYTVTNGVSELGEEKNFEEVYQYYNYYEAVFDSQEHIVLFKAYLRGTVDFSEIYFYDNEGKLEKKEVTNSDDSKSVTNF